MSPDPRGGPALAQERRLVTEIPGPRSRELRARREFDQMQPPGPPSFTIS